MSLGLPANRPGQVAPAPSQYALDYGFNPESQGPGAGPLATRPIAAGDTLQGQLGRNVGTIGTALATGEAKSIAEQSILDANRKSGLEILSGVSTQFGSKFI